MAIPVTRPPLKPHEGKGIYWTCEELIRLDDALCYYLSAPNGEVREGIAPETVTLVRHMIDKINRHI